MKQNKNQSGCDPCEQMFEHKVHELVREGRTPTAETHHRKQEEVKAAFNGHKPAAHTTTHTAKAHAAHTPAKHPVGAGAKTKK